MARMRMVLLTGACLLFACFGVWSLTKLVVDGVRNASLTGTSIDDVRLGDVRLGKFGRPLGRSYLVDGHWVDTPSDRHKGGDIPFFVVDAIDGDSVSPLRPISYAYDEIEVFP